MNFLDVEIRKRDKIKEFKKVVLFGAGSYLDEVLESFKDYNIVAIFDNKISGEEKKTVNDIPLLNPRFFFDKYVDEETVIVMSVCSYQYEIAVDLVENYHVNSRQIFSMCADYQEERIYETDTIQSHIKELEIARDIFSDEESKIYFDNMIKFKFTHNPLYLKPNPHIIGKYMYRESDGKIITARKGDHIIDGGAFVGDSVEYFLNLTDMDCKLYCFEPFTGNYNILDKMVCEKKLQDKVKTFNFALGDKNDTVTVSAENTVSARANMNANGKIGNFIVQRKLDDLAKEIQRIDFIKLDVEGDEKIVLQGGENMIKKYKPEMMVSAYHKSEDLWELPILLQKINPEYKIYFGHQPHAAFEPEIYVR